MDKTRLRKTFQYPSEDGEDDTPKEMDEEGICRKRSFVESLL